jgi:hypothetical protein
MMLSQPYLALYTGDWKKDPNLSLCSPATRGIWIDLLCSLHDAHVSQLTATPEQFSRLCRCDIGSMLSALHELQNTGAATVSEREGSFTVICRRMKKAEEISTVRAFAGSKGGAKAQAKPKQTLDIEIENENGSEKKRKDRAENLGAVLSFCREISLTKADAEWFWHKCEANGWTNGGKKILDWRQVLRSWKAGGYVPSIKNPERGKPPRSRTDEPLKRRFESVESPDPIIVAAVQKLWAQWKEKGRPIGNE